MKRRDAQKVQAIINRWQKDADFLVELRRKARTRRERDEYADLQRAGKLLDVLIYDAQVTVNSHGEHPL